MNQKKWFLLAMVLFLGLAVEVFAPEESLTIAEAATQAEMRRDNRPQCRPRVSVAEIEQALAKVGKIDAMEMMGVNSAGFLVLPKVVATTVLSPLLMLLSLALGLLGGWIVVEATYIIPPASYVTGIKAFYNGFYIFYSCFKMSLFCFMISSIAAFNGYYAKGGSLGVGHSSTKAIVITSILILFADLVVTQLMLY